MSLFHEFISGSNQIKIISDGDLDGISATGLLLQYFDKIGITIKYRYPAPAKIRGLSVTDSILIELPPTKGIEYQGKNLLIDHHNNAPHIQIFSDNFVMKSESLSIEVKAVTEIILALIQEMVNLPKIAEEVLDSISNIDQGIYKSQLDQDLHHAYLLEIGNTEMRRRVTEWVRTNQWTAISDWAEEGRSKWAIVDQRTKYFIQSAKRINNAVYFLYSEKAIDRAAMRNAMLHLEEKFPIVVAIQSNEDETVSRLSIGTKQTDIDLTPFFEAMRRYSGVTAGGRKTIGGVQFPNNSPLSLILEYLALNLESIRM